MIFVGREEGGGGGAPLGWWMTTWVKRASLTTLVVGWPGMAPPPGELLLLAPPLVSCSCLAAADPLLATAADAGLGGCGEAVEAMGFMEVNWIVLGRAGLVDAPAAPPADCCPLLPGGCAAPGGGAEKDWAPMPWMPSGDEARNRAGPGWTGVAGGRATVGLLTAAAELGEEAAATAAAAAAAAETTAGGTWCDWAAKDEGVVHVVPADDEAAADDDRAAASDDVAAAGVVDDDEVVVVVVEEEEVKVAGEVAGLALALAFSKAALRLLMSAARRLTVRAGSVGSSESGSRCFCAYSALGLDSVESVACCWR